MRCTKCGTLKPHFASGVTEKGIPREDTGKCMSCRQGKRPGAQMHGGDLKALLTVLNSRHHRKGVTA